MSLAAYAASSGQPSVALGSSEPMRLANAWSKLALWRQGIVAGAALVAGVLQAMDQYDMKTSWKWFHKDSTLFWSIVIAGVLVLLNTVGDFLLQRRLDAVEGRSRDIHKAVIGVLAVLSVKIGHPVTDLGANVFVVRRPRLQKIRRKVPRLQRIERVRLADYPERSNVEWSEGKGVIGECWANGRPEHVLWAPLAKRWDRKKITDNQWLGLRTDPRVAGMTRKDFMTMASKYAEIKAVPIKDEHGNVVGVLAVDRVWRSEGHQGAQLNNDDIEDTLVTTAVVIHDVMTNR